MNQQETLNQIIQSRKSVFPVNYIEKEIERDVIEQIMSNANRAPTHRFTEPWRFRIIKGNKRVEFGDFLAQQYVEMNNPEDQKKGKTEKIKLKTQQADTIITICMQRDPNESVPEWEEIASVAMAVQNMYLSCEAYGIGCYWSTPKMINRMDQFHAMEKGERCIGIFYMGYYDKDLPTSQRKPLADKVTWL